MVRVSGPLVNVTTSASSVRDVQVHTKKVRAWGDGLMTPDPSPATLSNGAVEFEAAPGPVVMVLFMAEAGAETVSLVVPDADSASLADCARLAGLADDATRSELERLAADALAAVSSARDAVRDATDALTTAQEAVGVVEGHADRAEEAEAGAVTARIDSETGQELSEDAAAVAVAAAIGVGELAEQSELYETAIGTTIQALDVLSYDVDGSNFIPSTLGGGLLRTSPATGATEVAPGSGLYALTGVPLVQDPRDPNLYRIGA